MIAAIHQPNFLPWLGYFHKMASCDRFIFLDAVAFSKGSYTNRVQVKTPAGPAWLTVAVQTSGRLGQPIRDVRVDDRNAWRQRVAGIMENSYRKAPYFSRFGGPVLDLIRQGPPSLCELNIALIDHLAALLEIRTPRIRGSGLTSTGQGADLLISLCREIGADTYLSGAGAAGYQDAAAYAQAGIRLEYGRFQHPEYPQQHGGFVKGMSVIDLIFNCGPDARRVLEGTLSVREPAE